MKSIKISVVTLTAMALLIFSGVTVPTLAAKPQTTGVGVTHIFSSASPTFVGTADAFLTGPTQVSSQFQTTPTVTTSPTGLAPNSLNSKINNLNDKPLVKDPPPTSFIPPTLHCPGFACHQISSVSLATTNPTAMNANGSAPFTVEPPDQALCVGNGYVVEALNQGEVQVFSARTLQNVSNNISLDSLMGLTAIGYSSGGDPMCAYDSANGGHFFITQFVSATPESAEGPYGGCFAAAPDTCFEGIAVSVTNNPMGAYYVYFLNPNTVNNDPGSDANPSPTASQCTAAGYPSDCGHGVLLNDYTKTALTRDAFLLFYDEFPLYGGFNGAQEFAFQKSALESGSSSVNVAYENMGTAPNLSPIPANGIYQPFAISGTNWYQVIPVQTTDPRQYDNSNGGTGFMVASLDYFGAGDNRTAVFDWTGLGTLNSASCSNCGNIQFGGAIITSTVTYQDEGGACLASQYLTLSTFCGLAPQKAGPTPLGDNCASIGDGEPATCPENGIATNGDGATNAFYSQGMIWTAVSTIVGESFHTGTEYHVGATYWGISTSHMANIATFSLAAQGYVAAAHEDIEFPAMGAAGGTVLMSFTLSGNGGPTGADNGGYYPSSAYLILTNGNSPIHIAALGQSPQDGFSEYQFYGTSNAQFIRPRWGDYGQVVFNAATGKFFFSSEYIQSSCSNSAYQTDPSCGGTRAQFANWGTSINSLSA